MGSLFGRYTFFQVIRLAVNVVRTKLTFSNARLIRFPIDIRGKKFISIGKGFTTGIGCRIEAYPHDNKSCVLHLGNNIQINDYVHITAIKQVILEDNVLLASKIYISDSSHGSYSGDEYDSSPESIPKERPYSAKPVIIKKNVWLGEMVTVLPGVTIGEGTIVGANSVVTKDLPANVIAVGTPAKPIKKYNPEKQKWELINKNKLTVDNNE